jgi:hypothetical protein
LPAKIISFPDLVLILIDVNKLILFLDSNKKNLEIKNYTLFNNNWLILIEK